MAWWTALTASAARTTLVQNISCALLVIILWTFFFENNRPASRRPSINESSSSSRRTACKATPTWTSTRKGKIDHFYSDELKLEIEFALVSYFHKWGERSSDRELAIFSNIPDRLFAFGQLRGIFCINILEKYKRGNDSVDRKRCTYNI